VSVGEHSKVFGGEYVLSSLILCVALDGTETQLLDEFLAQVKNDHLRSTNLLGLGLDFVPVLLLSNIGKEADDFITLIQQPAQDGAGVKTACKMLVIATF
jgi:hypothetical protein